MIRFARLHLVAAGVAFLAAAAGANAQTFSVNPIVGPMLNADGTTPLTEGTFTYVADVERDGFGAFVSPDTYGSTDSDDSVIGIFAINNVFDTPGILSDTHSFPAPEGFEGTPILGVFYDNVFESAADGPGEGIDFGIVDNGFTAPSPGAGGVPFNFFNTSLGGNQDAAALSATDGTTIPEPGTATAMIAALGGLVMMSRRRRSA